MDSARQTRPIGPAVDERTAGTRPADVRGDPAREDAFRRLAEQHLDGSYRLAAVIMGDGVAAQDAAHDAFVAAWQKWHTLRDTASFEAWFRRILVNTCRNQLRRGRRTQVREITDDMMPAASDPAATLDDQVIVRRALERLMPDDRIVLALRYYRDMKVDDVASAVGIRPRAVASRLHRALERLRRELDEQERREAGR